MGGRLSREGPLSRRSELLLGLSALKGSACPWHGDYAQSADTGERGAESWAGKGAGARGLGASLKGPDKVRQVRHPGHRPDGAGTTRGLGGPLNLAAWPPHVPRPRPGVPPLPCCETGSPVCRPGAAAQVLNFLTSSEAVWIPG